jgi:VWFA-related protein
MSAFFFRGLCCVALLSLISLSAFAQTEGQRQETIKINTDLVVLDAQVTNKKTRELIRNLTLQDFELFEDDTKQQIEYFSQDKLPLSVVLLLDISPSVHPMIEEVRKGALQALQSLKPEDEVAVMVFAGVTELVQDFTKDRQRILDQIGVALTKDGSGTRIHEAVGKAARQFKRATIPTSRRVIIVITDNQGSMLRKQDGVSEAEIKDAVIESGAAVCGVIVRSFLNVIDGILFQHPMMQEHFKRTSVNPYAEMSGGEMTAASKETINTRLGEMIDRLRNRYSLGYSPTNQDFNGKFRRVRLSLTAEAKKRLGAEALVNAKPGYYAIDKETASLLAEADSENKPAENAGAATKADSPALPDPKNATTGDAGKGDANAATADTNAASASRPAQPDSPNRNASNSSEAKPMTASRPRRVSSEEEIANPFAHLVMLDVVALNKKTGVMIKDLNKEDFEIEDNGAKQPVVHFSRGETPLSVVLMIDVAGNTSYALSSLRRGVKQWMGKLNPDDEVALMAFGCGSALIQDFTSDHKKITLKLRNFTEEARKQNLGPYQCRTDAVFQAAEQLDKTANPLNRRVIVVVTDDTKSFEGGKSDLVAERVLGSGSSVYALVAKGTRNSRKGKVTRAVVESAIYSFGNPIAFAISLGTRIGTEAALNAILNDRSFGRVVAKSGGSMTPADGDETTEKLAALFGHLRNRYIIGFAPPPHTSGERFHKLTLKLAPKAKRRGSEISVVTAQGYFARKVDPSIPQETAEAVKK